MPVGDLAMPAVAGVGGSFVFILSGIDGLCGFVAASARGRILCASTRSGSTPWRALFRPCALAPTATAEPTARRSGLAQQRQLLLLPRTRGRQAREWAPAA